MEKSGLADSWHAGHTVRAEMRWLRKSGPLRLVCKGAVDPSGVCAGLPWPGLLSQGPGYPRWAAQWLEHRVWVGCFYQKYVVASK